jgi:RNA polymerase sigma factor (sigma-70 family)
MSVALCQLVRQMRRVINLDAKAGDSILLGQWLDGADQNAFELLVWRHGPMVWDTCRRMLRHQQDAEDAFQATFLALARKASSIRQSASLAGWLYRVASRAALAARSRPNRAESRGDLDQVALARSNATGWSSSLDEELGQLPERYREPFILCCVQGLTNDEAAEVLGCPRGTVGTRVAWARRKLRERLGSAVPAYLPAGCVPALLVDSVLQTIGSAKVALPVAGILQEVMTMLFVNKVKSSMAVLIPVLLIGTGVGGFNMIGTSAATSAEAKPLDEKKPATDSKPTGEKKPTSDNKPTGEKPNSDKKPGADSKAFDIQGVIKNISVDGKTLTIALPTTMKGEEPKMFELKLTDKTAVRFSSVGPDEAKAKEGYLVMAALADNSKDTASRVVFHGDKSAKAAKGSGPSFTATITSVAGDGKSFTIMVSPKKNEPESEKIIKLTDKTIQEYHLVGAGEAKLTKGLKVAVWLADGSEDIATRVLQTGKAELPTSPKLGGEVPVYQGVISKIVRVQDETAITIEVPGEKKKGEASKIEVELKLTKDSKQIFMTAGPGMAQVMAGQTASIWVNPNTKDTVAVGVFQTKKQEVQAELNGKVIAAAGDGRSFTLLVPPMKTKAGEEVAPSKEVKVALADAARIIFVNVAVGGARITTGYSARVILAEGSKETVATVIFSGE